ncbi:MAG: cyclic nucleotide-binding domain-containing protein [Treponema sp.]|jgi:CRP-like cAMP-binding protein|nr:cyclic nucleotide-binding domain-containing protein [Treponema sp.]
MSDHLQLAFVSFYKGAYIIVEGKQNADCFFIIRQGRVRISKEVEVVREEDILGPGDFFGVISTMSGHSHIETAQALTNVTLIAVQRDQYSQLIQDNTPVAMKIILQFSKRMRYLDESLTQLTLKSSTENDPSILFKIGEYYARQNQYNLAFYAYNQYVKYNPAGQDVGAARTRMMKIVPYVKGLTLSFKKDEAIRNYPKDTMIFSEGETGDELYIIQKGSVKIVKIMDDKEMLLAVLRIGDIFGEMAVLESKPRAASAIAYEDCQILAINRVNFTLMISVQPQIVARLTILLADRIWFIYKQLANTLLSDPLGRIYDALQIQLEKNRVSLKSSSSFTFDFGPNELANMVGLSQGDGAKIFRKLLENRNFLVVKDKLYIVNVSEVVRQAEYYRKIQSRSDKTRSAGSQRD